MKSSAVDTRSDLRKNRTTEKSLRRNCFTTTFISTRTKTHLAKSPVMSLIYLEPSKTCSRHAQFLNNNIGVMTLTFWYAMDFLPNYLCQNGKISVQEILFVREQVCDAEQFKPASVGL